MPKSPTSNEPLMVRGKTLGGKMLPTRILFKGGGGGGGGAFNPDFWENTILKYELAMMARTCTNNLRVVLSP